MWDQIEYFINIHGGNHGLFSLKFGTIRKLVENYLDSNFKVSLQLKF